jgi:ABC-type transport system involved in multi-copper enzyme maturation permease subunit
MSPKNALVVFALILATISAFCMATPVHAQSMMNVTSLSDQPQGSLQITEGFPLGYSGQPAPFTVNGTTYTPNNDPYYVHLDVGNYTVAFSNYNGMTPAPPVQTVTVDENGWTAAIATYSNPATAPSGSSTYMSLIALISLTAIIILIIYVMAKRDKRVKQEQLREPQ